MYAGGHGDVLGGVGEETVVFRVLATLLPHPAATLLIWLLDHPDRKMSLFQKIVGY